MDLYIGLMSGTSMDGIDAALIEIPSNKLIYGLTKKYSPEVHTSLKQLMSTLHTSLADLCQLNSLIGRDFAEAVQRLLTESGYAASAITAIGSHGQTVCHDTKDSIPYTLQLGCAHTISSLTGIDVVADFRTRDLVNGGQGAPFAPLYHKELLGQAGESIAVVNIGGIANITYLHPGQSPSGWDVGPGNCLMDAWISLHQDKHYDEQGHWAAEGTVINSLLDRLLLDPFFNQALPKSIGKEYFSLQWLNSHLSSDYKAVDIQATLLDLTASCIAKTILEHQQKIKKLYLCGGGAHNLVLFKRLQVLLPDLSVASVAELGISPDYLEAMMFAWLAAQTLQKKTVDLRSITGSKSKEILGAIYPIKKINN